MRLDKGDNLSAEKVPKNDTVLTQCPQDKEQYSASHDVKISFSFTGGMNIAILLCSNNTCPITFFTD